MKQHEEQRKKRTHISPVLLKLVIDEKETKKDRQNNGRSRSVTRFMLLTTHYYFNNTL